MRFALHCTCGASWTGDLPYEPWLRDLEAAWRKTHRGDGHAACDSKTANRAARARRKADQVSESLEPF